MDDGATTRGELHVESESLTPGYSEPSFAARFIARCVDAILFMPVVLVLGSVLADPQADVAAGVLIGLYEIAMTVRSSQTVGKMLLRLRIVDRTSGGPIGVGSATIRWALWALPVIVGSVVAPLTGFLSLAALVVFLFALRPPLHQGLHDLAAHTVVTRTEG